MLDPSLAALTTLFGPEFGHGKAFELARLRIALGALGAPQENLPPIFHVAGTNGKGSTIAFMRAIAEAAGLSVHAFTKPHLLQLNERFCVAGAIVETDALIAGAERVARVAPGLTQFEAQVAIAFLLFAESPADLCLIEAGMGGRDDATNVILAPALSVITPIALDHQEILGPTLAHIASHKAGILKAHFAAIVARQAREVMEIIEAEAALVGAPLWRQGAEWDAHASGGRLLVQTQSQVLDLPLPALAGAHQIDNAGLAIAALLASNCGFEESAIARGIETAAWPGRLQPITRGALWRAARGVELWIDGGHNAHAARALARALAEMNCKRPARTALIIGIRARKDWRGFLDELARAADLVIAVPLAHESANPADLAAYAQALGVASSAAHDLGGAISQARAANTTRVLVCGSLQVAADALARS